MTRQALATPDDVRDMRLDIETVSPYLHRASTRVYGYLRGRSSAYALFADDSTVPIEVREIVCAIANRMASTSEQVIKGVSYEQIDGGGVTWGSQAYVGTADLIDAEKAVLDRLYPRMPFTIDVDPQ